MLTMKISIIEHWSLVVQAALSNKENNLARCGLMKDNEDFLSNEELHWELGDDYISLCSQLTYKADRQTTKQRIL